MIPSTDSTMETTTMAAIPRSTRMAAIPRLIRAASRLSTIGWKSIAMTAAITSGTTRPLIAASPT